MESYFLEEFQKIIFLINIGLIANLLKNTIFGLANCLIYLSEKLIGIIIVTIPILKIVIMPILMLQKTVF